MAGAIAYVMGPSGAGKDTLLRTARAMLAGERIAFAHRYITRPLVAGDEEFVPLTPAEFSDRHDAGFFAMHWLAHGVGYAIGTEIDVWRRAGWLVVVSGSREHFNAKLGSRSDVAPILVTARPDVLARRLGARGREDGAAVSARLARQVAITQSGRPLATIDNSDALDDAAAALVRQLRTLAREIAPVS